MFVSIQRIASSCKRNLLVRDRDTYAGLKEFGFASCCFLPLRTCFARAVCLVRRTPLESQGANTRSFLRRPLSILSRGQGRSSPARSKAFHRARPTLTTRAIPRVQASQSNAGTKVDLPANHQTSMTFIQQFEAELTKKLISSETSEAIVRWSSEKILESYRNGITAGRKGETVKRHGKSRRRDSSGKAE